jgi:hypothetical protein
MLSCGSCNLERRAAGCDGARVNLGPSALDVSKRMQGRCQSELERTAARGHAGAAGRDGDEAGENAVADGHHVIPPRAILDPEDGDHAGCARSKRGADSGARGQLSFVRGGDAACRAGVEAIPATHTR